MRIKQLKSFVLVVSCVVFLFSCGENKSITDDEMTRSETSNSEKINSSDSVQNERLQGDSQVGDENQRFNQFKAKFIEDFWKLNPGYALYSGYYKYDDQLTVPNQQNQTDKLEFIKVNLSRLSEFDLSLLDKTNASDFYIIENQLKSSQWYITEFKSGQWNPSQYNVAGAFGLILNTNYKSLDERLMTISTRLTQIPEYYQTAINNITIPTLPHTSLAIQQSKGALGVFENDIPNNIEKSTLSDEKKQELQNKLESSIKAINDYIDWLEKKKISITDSGGKNFRIGKALYEKKFKFDIVTDFTGEELYEKALSEKTVLHNRMIKITKQLWPKYFPEVKFPSEDLKAVKELIDHLSVKHVKREEFVDEVRRQIPILEAYIRESNVIELDASRPLVVRETPKYQRGFAGASVNAPGPYDATANTYYNVTPLDDYTPEQAESYLREYNHWILQILNIHEALPGHYVQLVYSNKSPSMIKSIFANGAMIEGWAVYSERMLLESGYGDQEPELWLMYSKWNLRVVVNTILDYSIQVLGMSEKNGLDLLMNQGFQEKTEATGKWKRATLSQVQLTSYFSGYSEIYQFRESLKKSQGKDFDLKAFHNEFLSYGSAPVPIIKKLMTAE